MADATSGTEIGYGRQAWTRDGIAYGATQVLLCHVPYCHTVSSVCPIHVTCRTVAYRGDGPSSRALLQ
eukprot:2874193-Rhodomonas_salina.1